LIPCARNAAEFECTILIPDLVSDCLHTEMVSMHGLHLPKIDHRRKEEETTTLLTNEMSETPLHLLRDSFIELYKLPDNLTVTEAIKAFQDGNLERIEHPQEEKQHL